MKYDKKNNRIIIDRNDEFDSRYLNCLISQYNVLIEIPNTKNITSKDIKELLPSARIRVVGGYTEDRIKNNGKVHFKNGETGEYYTSAVIYTRDELIAIIEEMERIEEKINHNWNDIQKLVYIYDKLKSSIMYDPQYEYQPSSRVRSLRGLITKQTVCSGFSLILKEMLDRQGIECEYVEGYTHKNKKGGHSWNIVILDGYKYPLDITWDNTKYRGGLATSFDYLGQNVISFSRSHYPLKWEPTQDYIHTLSQFDKDVIKQINIEVNKTKEFNSTVYRCIRKDHSEFILAQVGNHKFGNKEYYRYYYQDILSDKKNIVPLILYSETNVAKLIDDRNFGKPLPENYETAINDILFSRQNIEDSLSKKTFYIGEVGDYLDKEEITKPQEKRELFPFPTKRFVRKDGSIMIIQQMSLKPYDISKIKVNRYDVFELIRKNNQYYVKRNIVYTEKDLFNDNRESMIDEFLSRIRIDQISYELGGYLGNYAESGKISYNQDLLEHFKNNNHVIYQKYRKENILPSFEELKNYALKYDYIIDRQDPTYISPNDIKVFDIKNNQIEHNPINIQKALLANFWLLAAGTNNKQDPDIKTAFSKDAKELYNILCLEIIDDIDKKGYIDTISLFRRIKCINKHKYNREIVVKLFKNQYQTEIINSIFLKAMEINTISKESAPLYSVRNATKIINDNRKKR